MSILILLPIIIGLVKIKVRVLEYFARDNVKLELVDLDDKGLRYF